MSHIAQKITSPESSCTPRYGLLAVSGGVVAPQGLKLAYETLRQPRWIGGLARIRGGYPGGHSTRIGAIAGALALTVLAGCAGTAKHDTRATYCIGVCLVVETSHEIEESENDGDL